MLQSPLIGSCQSYPSLGGEHSCPRGNVNFNPMRCAPNTSPSLLQPANMNTFTDVSISRGGNVDVGLNPKEEGYYGGNGLLRNMPAHVQLDEIRGFPCGGSLQMHQHDEMRTYAPPPGNMQMPQQNDINRFSQSGMAMQKQHDVRCYPYPPSPHSMHQPNEMRSYPMHQSSMPMHQQNEIHSYSPRGKILTHKQADIRNYPMGIHQQREEEIHSFPQSCNMAVHQQNDMHAYSPMNIATHQSNDMHNFGSGGNLKICGHPDDICGHSSAIHMPMHQQQDDMRSYQSHPPGSMLMHPQQNDIRAYQPNTRGNMPIHSHQSDMHGYQPNLAGNMQIHSQPSDMRGYQPPVGNIPMQLQQTDIRGYQPPPSTNMPMNPHQSDMRGYQPSQGNMSMHQQPQMDTLNGYSTAMAMNGSSGNIPSCRQRPYTQDVTSLPPLLPIYSDLTMRSIDTGVPSSNPAKLSPSIVRQGNPNSSMGHLSDASQHHPASATAPSQSPIDPMSQSTLGATRAHVLYPNVGHSLVMGPSSPDGLQGARMHPGSENGPSTRVCFQTNATPPQGPGLQPNLIPMLQPSPSISEKQQEPNSVSSCFSTITLVGQIPNSQTATSKDASPTQWQANSSNSMVESSLPHSSSQVEVIQRPAELPMIAPLPPLPPLEMPTTPVVNSQSIPQPEIVSVLPETNRQDTPRNTELTPLAQLEVMPQAPQPNAASIHQQSRSTFVPAVHSGTHHFSQYHINPGCTPFTSTSVSHSASVL